MADLVGLENRTVIVAGAGAGGIGEAVTVVLGQLGASVVALDHDGDRLAGTVRSSQAAQVPCRGIVVDVCDRAQVRDVVSAVAAEGPPLHGLVHVVGGLPLSQWSRFVDYDLEVFDQVMRLNLSSTVTMSQAVALALVAGDIGGSIVHIASVSGLVATPYGAPYGAAKAAIISLTKTMAVELGAHRIRVNAVAPGTVSPGGADPVDDASRSAIPLRRRGVGADIGGAAAYLLSDLSAFVSGQVIAVDGGSSVKPSYLDDDDFPVFVPGHRLRQRVLGLE